jgi:choline dehydrogenase
MITVYPHDSDWQQIADLTGDSSWAPDHMRTYFEKLERCTYSNNPAGERHGTKGWLTTTGLDLKMGLGDPAVMKTVLDAVVAAWGKGELFPHDPNNWNQRPFTGITFSPLSTLNGRRVGTRERINSVRATFPQRLIIKSSNLAAKILFDDHKRAIGVECWEGEHLYRADPNASDQNPHEVKRYYCSREVILAGGAFNSPQLLMLSGVGPADHLQKFGIPVVAGRAGVGSNLQDRYEIGVVSEMKRDWELLKHATFEPPQPGQPPDPCYADWQNGKGVYTTNGSMIAVITKSKAAGADDDPDLFLFAVAGKFYGYFQGYSKKTERTKNFLTWMVLKAHTKNPAGTVRLRSTDPRDHPDINFNYFSDPATAERDLDALVEGFKFARNVSKRNSFVKSESMPGSSVSSDADIRQYIQNNAWGHHASCSNPMGRRDDPNAVVAGDFRVIGVDGLRVVDASVFPRIPGFFIVTSIYMIAEKAADVIIADAAKAG